MAYIDNKIEFLSKSISAMSSLADDFVLDVDSQTTDLDIGFELLTCNYMQQQSSDLALSEEQQANALTVLVNNLDLNNVPASLTYALPVSYAAASTITISHNNQTLAKQGGSSVLDEFFHLTLAQVQKLNQVNLSPLFSDIGGDPLANASLNSLFSGKQASINTGSSGQFYAWDKTMRQVLFSNLGSVPTTLAGYGISAGDTLFDNRYIQAANPITGYTIGANAILTNADTWIGSLGKLQAQISNRENYLGLPAVNGYVLSSTTAGVRSWVPFAGGGTVNSVAIASSNGFAGSSVTAAGVSTVTIRTSVTGILKGNGTTISAATPMTDYLDTTGAANGDTILYTGGVATWSPGLVNPMTLLGDLIIGGASGATTRLAGNTTTTRKFLMSVGASGAALSQTYETLLAGDIPAIDISQVTNLQNTLDGYLPDALANNMIFIGNSISNVAVNAIVAGDLTALYVNNSGTNEAQFTIGNKKVTYAKIQDVTSQAILGRFALADGEVQQLSLSADFVINSGSGVIGLATPTPPLLTAKGDILTRTGAATVALNIGGSATFFMADPAATTGNKWVAMSGDATIAVSGALTIAAGAVTLAKMANMATASFIGRTTAGTGVPEILTATQATAMLNLFSTSATTKGLVPGSNSVGATYYLDATGNWSVPAGGGGGSGTVTSVSVVSANGFAGTVATNTTTPAITLTTTITGLLKGNGTAISAATAGTDYAPATSGTSILYGDGAGGFSNVTIGTGISFSAGTLSATGSGNVVGPGPSVVANNFAVYNGTGGLTIGEPTGASLDASGNAAFLSVRVTGTSGAGHMHFRHQASAVAGTANSNTIYALPVASNGFGFVINNDAYASSLVFGATAARTYTLPDLTGTFALTNAINVWGSGVKQTFAPDATNAGINVGTLAGQPSSPANGDLVYNSSATALQAYINGAWVSLGAGGGGGGTVTSVAALTLGTTGTDLTSTVANGTTTPVITLNVPDASATARGVVTTGTQTIAGAKTFSGSTTFSLASGGAIILSGTGSTASAAISFTGATMRWINFGAAGAAPPTITTARSLGTKLVFSNTFASGSANDFAIGLDTFSFWFTLQNNSASYSFQWYGGASSVMQLVGNGQLTLTPVVQTSGAIKGFAFTGPLNTGQSSGVEISSFGWTTTGRQWATGAIGTQREFLITAPTYSFVGASTITNAGTFVVAGAPIAGTNATITNAYALWVQGGVSLFGGNIRLTQTVTTETVISDTTVTMVINGTTYKLLARA